VKTIMTRNGNSKRPQTRLGRPHKDLAGDVKSRILDAAQRIFLKRGYQNASVGEIAEMAPASKPTIYSHFGGKEALFGAVVARVITGLTNFEGYEPRGRTVTEKLTSVGTELVEKFLDDTVGVTRATIAEANRFPALSRHVHESGRDRAAAAVSHVLNNAVYTLRCNPKGPFSNKRSLANAQIFIDLILLPMLMRALTGEDAKYLRKQVPSFVRERVNFFLAACETDWGRRRPSPPSIFLGEPQEGQPIASAERPIPDSVG
jgi:AcrR family transcriptional regulator